MNRNYEKRDAFVCVIDRDEDGIVVTEWTLNTWEHAREYIETNADEMFCDCPPEHGEYVVSGVYVETSEARTRDYPGSFEQVVIASEYTFLVDATELEVA